MLRGRTNDTAGWTCGAMCLNDTDDYGGERSYVLESHYFLDRLTDWRLFRALNESGTAYITPFPTEDKQPEHRANLWLTGDESVGISLSS